MLRNAVPLARRLARSGSQFALPSSGTRPATRSVDKRRVAAMARTRSSLARHSERLLAGHPNRRKRFSTSSFRIRSASRRSCFCLRGSAAYLAQPHPPIDCEPRYQDKIVGVEYTNSRVTHLSAKSGTQQSQNLGKRLTRVLVLFLRRRFSIIEVLTHGEYEHRKSSKASLKRAV